MSEAEGRWHLTCHGADINQRGYSDKISVGTLIKPALSNTTKSISVIRSEMAVIHSPTAAQTSGTAYADFASPSAAQTVQVQPGPSNRPNRGSNAVRELSGLPNGQGKRLNGPPVVGSAGAESNDILPEQQELARARTAENQAWPPRSKHQLTRRRTDYERGHQPATAQMGPSEELGELRHGWEDQYNSSEFLGQLSSVRFTPVIKFLIYMLNIDYFRLSICTSRTNDTRAVENQERIAIQNRRRNGVTKIATKPSRQPSSYASISG